MINEALEKFPERSIYSPGDATHFLSWLQDLEVTMSMSGNVTDDQKSMISNLLMRSFFQFEMPTIVRVGIFDMLVSIKRVTPQVVSQMMRVFETTKEKSEKELIAHAVAVNAGVMSVHGYNALMSYLKNYGSCKCYHYYRLSKYFLIMVKNITEALERDELPTMTQTFWAESQEIDLEALKNDISDLLFKQVEEDNDSLREYALNIIQQLSPSFREMMYEKVSQKFMSVDLEVKGQQRIAEIVFSGVQSQAARKCCFYFLEHWSGRSNLSRALFQKLLAIKGTLTDEEKTAVVNAVANCNLSDSFDLVFELLQNVTKHQFSVIFDAAKKRCLYKYNFVEQYVYDHIKLLEALASGHKDDVFLELFIENINYHMIEIYKEDNSRSGKFNFAVFLSYALSKRADKGFIEKLKCALTQEHHEAVKTNAGEPSYMLFDFLLSDQKTLNDDQKAVIFACFKSYSSTRSHLESLFKGFNCDLKINLDIIRVLLDVIEQQAEKHEQNYNIHRFSFGDFDKIDANLAEQVKRIKQKAVFQIGLEKAEE